MYLELNGECHTACLGSQLDPKEMLPEIPHIVPKDAYPDEYHYAFVNVQLRKYGTYKKGTKFPFECQPGYFWACHRLSRKVH